MVFHNCFSKLNAIRFDTINTITICNGVHLLLNIFLIMAISP
nr:MAG TPA: hypothetical protein [Caudoviricetes sp.]